jgi:RNA polymerase sigma-70 factor, ECF subfamily
LIDTLLPTAWQGDATLLKRAAQGNEQAARQLVKQLGPKAHALAWRMLSDSGEAEDVVQEAFIKLLGNRSYAGRSALATYFHTVVARLCLDRLRARPQASLNIDDLAEVTSDEQASPAQAYDQQQSALGVQQALQQLNPRQRLAVSLWAYQDADAKEIAAVLDIDTNAAHQLLHRAKLNLKKLMNGVEHER